MANLVAPTKPAEYPFVHDDGTKKDKEVVVAVFVAADPGTETLMPGAEATLAADLARRLPDLERKYSSRPKLKVLDPVVVNKFKLKTPNWILMFATECGRQLGADFVLVVHLDRVSLYQSGSHDSIYEARADVAVEVFDVTIGLTGPKYRYEQTVRYPPAGAPDASTVQAHRFRREFIYYLASTVAFNHVEHKEVDAGRIERPSVP